MLLGGLSSRAAAPSLRQQAPRHAAAAAAGGSGARRPRRGGPGRRPEPDAQPAPVTSDEALIRELNSAHLWLPGEEDDFGLDDVAAHVASRNQAQTLGGGGDPVQAAGRGGPAKRRAARGAPPPATLAGIDPASGQLPAWVADLQAAGFEVRSRSGELFLQRGGGDDAGEEEPGDADGFGSERARPAAPPPAPAEAAAAEAAQRAAAAAAAAAAAVPDKSLAVRGEFDPLVWQQQPAGGGQHTPLAPQRAADAWYGAPEAPPQQQERQQRQEQQQEREPLPPPSAPRRPSGSAGAADVRRVLLGFKHPDALLAHLEATFPVWAANGCWLLDQQAAGVVAAPTPAEAGVALKGVALAAKRAGLNPLQMQSLARDRRVLGLAEAMRLASPRLPPHQAPAITQRLWGVAKAYWRSAGATAAAAQQLLLAAVRAQRPAQELSGTAAGQVPALGPLLAQLQAAGVGLSREQLGAAASLVRARADDQVRKAAFVGGVWGLSVLGGPLFFADEVEALTQVAALGRWALAPHEVSDVLWALANARHWSPRLGELEAALLAAGGPRACTAPELVTALAGGSRRRRSSSSGGSSSSRLARGGGGKPQQAAGRLHELSPSQLTSLVWSLACMQRVDGALFRAAWQEVCVRGPRLGAEPTGLVRVAQAALAVELEGSYAPDALYCDDGTRQLLGDAAAAFKRTSGALAAARAHSSYQRSIAASLGRLRVMHVLEDADGPSHWARNAPRQRLGATAMKRRHLQALGWAVVNVPYTVWDGLAGEEARAAYLKRQVAAARAALAAAA
ncbi:AL1 [Scenedesmus sp. PABB004]|nr:AL1 [Scenedesmus sp. PABB004]